MEDVKTFGLGLVKAANVDSVVDEPAKLYKEKGTHDYSSAGNEERPSISATWQSQIASCRLGNTWSSCGDGSIAG
ncbi:hypothetical protein BDL97_07G042700 [Sphagnum fallax]|nr:hypothetical protein BDL97_07G042700 [Sphagnum fallax]